MNKQVILLFLLICFHNDHKSTSSFAKSNQNKYQILSKTIHQYIIFLVEFEEEQKNSINFEDILYIKDGNIFIKKTLATKNKKLYMDQCVMFNYESNYVLSALYWKISEYEYFSYLESIGKISKNSSLDTLNYKVSMERAYDWQPPKNFISNNFFGRCLSIAKKLINWLQLHYHP